MCVYYEAEFLHMFHVYSFKVHDKFHKAGTIVIFTEKLRRLRNRKLSNSSKVTQLECGGDWMGTLFSVFSEVTLTIPQPLFILDSA